MAEQKTILKELLDEGLALYNDKKYTDAIKIYKTAFVMIKNLDKYELGTLYIRLGNTYYQLNDIDKYVYYYEKYLKEFPQGQTVIFSRLGHAYYFIDCDKSVDYYNKALNADGGIRESACKLFSMIKSSSYNQQDIKDEAEFETARIKYKFFKNIKKYNHDDKKILKDKKLNIAYLTSDGHNHTMMHYMMPLWKNHDKDKFNFFIFNSSVKEDFIKTEINNLGFEVINSSQLNSEQLAEQIYNSKIDILIDLDGYTHLQSYCSLFKPAPIIISYLGYLNTLGMKEVDYILTDRYTIPEDNTCLYTEKPLYLDEGYCIFNYYNFSKIQENPFIRNGYITFGSFNCPSKINDTMIYMWCQILKKVENSKIFIYRTRLNKTVIKNLKSKFTKWGIDEDRVIFSNIVTKNYSDIYSIADISLDTYPFSGMSITIETALSGIPTITLTGEGMQSRGAGKINNISGNSDLNAVSGEEYIEIAINLANNKERLIEIRKNLREILKNSSLMNNHKSFTENLECKFQKVWETFVHST